MPKHGGIFETRAHVMVRDGEIGVWLDMHTFAEMLNELLTLQGAGPYAHACDDADCPCRRSLDFPDNIRDGCKAEEGEER